MDIRFPLPPKEVIDVLAQQVRKRIGALEGVKLREYTIAVYELRNTLDLLQRASAYVERSQANRRADRC